MATQTPTGSALAVDALLDAALGPDATAPRRLLTAAIAAFAERGYAATTTRDIAGRAGMSPAAMYVHYASKEQLLATISRFGHEQVLGAVRAAAAGEADPGARLAAVMRTLAAWHATHHTVARIVHYELGALSPEHYAEVTALRHEIEQVVGGVVAAGVTSGAFDPPDTAGAALAVLSLAVDVARWYSERGPRGPEGIGELYADLALRMVGARGV